MDPISQGLLAANAAQTLYAKKLRKHAVIIGAIAGIVPDIDIFIRSDQNPSLFLIYHRHFTHSLIFIPIGGLMVAALYLLIVSSLRPQWRSICIAAIVGYATHGLLDATTSYGTLLLWPFSHRRIAWAFMSIVDPIFSLILLAGVAIAWYRRSVVAARISLCLALLYIAFGAWQHHRASNAQMQLALTRQQTVVISQVIPSIGQLFYWRSIYVNQNQQIYLDNIHVPLWGKVTITKGIHLPVARWQPLPNRIKQNPIWHQDFETFRWFSHGFIAEFAKNPVIIADMRYVLTFKPITALWGIEFPLSNKRKHVYQRRNVVYSIKG